MVDIKFFKKSFKFVCNECGNFAHTETTYCEKCGVGALRKATKEDYIRYEMETTRDSKERRIEIERVDETRKVAERAEKVADKARRVAEKTEKEVEKKAEKAKRKAERTKQVAEKAAEKAKKASKRAKEAAKTETEET